MSGNMKRDEAWFAEYNAKRARWTRGGQVVNTDTPSGASVGSFDDVKSWSAAAAGGDSTLAHCGCAPAPVTVPIREQCHGSPVEARDTPHDAQTSLARGSNVDFNVPIVQPTNRISTTPDAASLTGQTSGTFTSGGVESRHAGGSESQQPSSRPTLGKLDTQYRIGSRLAPGPLTPYERDVLSAVLDYLKVCPRVAWFARMNSGGMTNESGQYVKFAFKGCSDIIGQMKDGRFLAIECKRPGKNATPDQWQFLCNVNRANGLAFVATCVDDVRSALA